jgi:spore coat polysaccharide biosynthesis protein SpsF
LTDLLTVLCARTSSERLPGKVLAPVCGSPLLAWIIRRLAHPATGVGGKVVVGTTTLPEDDEIEQVAQQEGVDCYRHPDPDDVTGRVYECARRWPARFILRALCDCPWLATDLVRRAVHVMRRAEGDLFLWYGQNTSLVYGAAEAPFSIRVWSQTNERATGDEREHPSLYVHRNRGLWVTSTCYHDPPQAVYYRHPQRMRLEVDWPEDLALVRAVSEKGPGMLAPLDEVVRWLDKHDEVAALNRHRVERTGNIASYPPDLHREWYKLMKDSPVWTWDNKLVESPVGRKGAPVCCDNCGLLLGWGLDGRFVERRTGGIWDEGRLPCINCGEVRVWVRAR